jgi:hypothetical protein
VYGVIDAADSRNESDNNGVDNGVDDGIASLDGSANDSAAADGPEQSGRPELVEPMFVARTGERIPDYDLREIDETLLVRVTESEFGA